MANYAINVKAQLDKASLDEIKQQISNATANITVGAKAGSTKNSSGGSGSATTTHKEGATQNLSTVFEKVSSFAMVTAVYGAMITGATKAKDAILGMNSALTEFAKVSDLSKGQLKELGSQASVAGLEVGRTGTEMVEASTEFQKSLSGLTTGEVMELATVSEMFRNIADSEISSADSASFLISQMKAFNIEAKDSITIIDKLNDVANKTNVGTNDLQLALSKVSSSLVTMGNSLDQTIGLVTAGTELMVGMSSKVALGLKSVGINLVNLAQSSSEAYTEIDGVKIALRDENGELLSTYETLEKLSGQWGNLSEETKANIGIALAGKTQYTVLTSVMSNFATAINAVEIAENSAGSAMNENARYMESYEAKISSINSSFEQWALNGDGVVQMTLSFVDGLLKANNQVEFLVPMATMLAFTTLPTLSTWLNATAASMFKVTTATTLMTGGLNLLIGVGLGVLLNLPKVFDAMTTSVDEHKMILEETKADYESLNSEISKLNSKTNKTSADELKLKILEAQAVALKSQVESQEKLTAQKAMMGDLYSYGTVTQADLATQSANNILEDILQQREDMENGGSSDGYLERVNDLALKYGTLLSQKAEIEDSLKYLSGEDKNRAEAVLNEIELVLEAGEAYGIFSESVAQANKEILDNSANFVQEHASMLEQFLSELDGMRGAFESLATAQDEYNAQGGISLDTYDELMSMGSEYFNLLFDEEGKLIDLDTAYNQIIKAKLRDIAVSKISTLALEYQAIAQGEATEVTKVASMVYDETKDSVIGLAMANVSLAGLTKAQSDSFYNSANQIVEWMNQAMNMVDTSGALGGATSSLTNKTDSYTDALKEQSDVLDKQLSYYDKALAYITSVVNKELDALGDKYEAEEKYWDDKIGALKEQNDELNDQIAMEEKLKALAEAKSRNILLYENGSFGYSKDVQGVSDAQFDVDELERTQELADQIAYYEKLKESALSSIQAQIDGWNNYLQAYEDIAQAYEDEQNKIYAVQLFGFDVESRIYNDKQGLLNEYNAGYVEISNQLLEIQKAQLANEIAINNSRLSSAVNTAKGILEAQKAVNESNFDYGGSGGYNNDPSKYEGYSSPSALANKKEDFKNMMFGGSYSTGGVDTKGGYAKLHGSYNNPEVIFNANDASKLYDMVHNMPLGAINNGYETINNGGANSVTNVFDNLTLNTNISDGQSFVDFFKNFKYQAIQDGSSI